MSASVIALVAFAGWTLLLLIVLVSLRTWLTLSGAKRANEFAPDGAGSSAFQQRLIRAHANCVENLPVFGAIVLAAIASGHSEVTNSLAYVVLGARFAQSLIHLSSTSALAVMARASMLLVQIAIEVSWIIALLRFA